MPRVPSSNEIEWMPLNQPELARFAPQLVAGLQWMLNALDETERALKLPRGRFDQPLQERLRKAS